MTDSDSDCSTLTDLSSELSSPPTSPIPPSLSSLPYPTPTPSQTQSNYSSSSEQECWKRRRKDGGNAPAKKRRLEASNSRSNEYLDINVDTAQTSMEQLAQLETLLKALHRKKKIVVVAGAGISTSAGIPDFRSAQGLFNSLRSENKLKASGKQLFDASVYQTDASTSSFHDMVRMLSKMVNGARPTLFHHLLATLADEGRLLRLYTQNIDGLETELEPLRTEIPLPKKGPWPRTVQLHGSLKKMVCAKCGDLRVFDPHLFDGPNPPSCTSCIDLDKVRTEEAGKRSHGIGKLRPRMVLYNEPNPDDEAIGSVVTSDLRARPDAIIVVGTTMEIPGVQRIVREMSGVISDRKDGKCIWINRRPPPTGPKYDDIWNLIVAGDCDRVAELADMRKWYEVPREGVRVTDSDAERAKAKDSEVKVIIRSTPEDDKVSVDSLPTPLSSPKVQAFVKKTGLKLNFKRLGETKLLTNSNKLTQGLSKPSKPKKSKNVKPKTGQTAGMIKLNSTFKISKPQEPTLKRQYLSEDSKPFDPIPPQSVRTNGSGGLPQDGPLMKLEKIEVKVGEATEEPGRLKRMSQERVSPTGSLPRHMAHILN